MNAQTDQQLLRDYTERRAEAAFTEVVRRHVDFVYSAALRMVCDAHLAEDVTQSVFAALAHNARQLTERPVLSGWLHRTTQNLAANIVRADVRRRAREQEAAAMNELLADSGTGVPPVWSEIAPHLDAALAELAEADRDAVLLRYFERKSAHEMALTLGTTDEAAQKRVTRAVERLREFFAKRGARVGASGLAFVISANAVQAAPAGLVVTISAAAAVAGTTIAATATATATKAIAMTTLQKTIIGTTLAVAAGTGIYEARQASRLRDQVQTLQQQQAPLTRQIEELSRERDEAARQLAVLRDDNERLNRNTGDLLKLRGEIGVLRRQLAQYQKYAASRATEAGQTSTGTGLTLTPEALQDVGNRTPEAAIQTLLWAATRKNGPRLAELFDRDSLLSAAFVKLRQARPDLTVSEAESIAKDFVDKLKLHLATGSFTNRSPDSIVSSRIEEVVGTNGVVAGTALFSVTHLLRDGTTESERLKLRQSGDQWFVTTSEESMGISFEPFAEASDNPELHEDNRPSLDNRWPN